MTQVGLGLNKVLSDTDSKQGFVTLFNGMWVCVDLLCSVVARGGAGGGPCPPVFFLESNNRPV